MAAPVTRDYFAELYVAGLFGDAGWAVYFPKRDVGFDFIASKFVAGNTILRPVQVKGLYPTSAKTDKVTFGFKGDLTAVHPLMVLALPYFHLENHHAPEAIALMPYDQVKSPSSGGVRCVPATFQSGRTKPRRDFAKYFGREGLSRVEQPNWGSGAKQVVHTDAQVRPRCQRSWLFAGHSNVRPQGTNMKSTTIAFAAALVAMAVHAQAADREAQFKRLEAAYARAPSVQQVPPLFTEWLRTARAVNSHVPPEAWKEIEAECVETLARSRTLALGIWLRHTFAKLSDADLEHLVTLREDPVMEKADAMAAAPDAQSEMIKMAGAQVVELPANAIRQVMLKHGLKVAPNSR